MKTVPFCTPLFLCLIGVTFLSGCNDQRQKQKDLALALWNLDQKKIAPLLAAHVDPYTLSLQDMKHIPACVPDTQISPYAFILEGYLDDVYMLEDFTSIKPALEQTYTCITLLVTQGISVDIGVVTMGSQTSFRTFVTDAINRLLQEQETDSTFDEEGAYALSLWQKIHDCIDTYQPFTQ